MMSKGRMEAFSDGVFAIILTIMVLELRPPIATSLSALRSVLPAFLSYILSFLYVGIYWNNHHHLLQATRHVTGGVLWANLHLLFWLSLTPFATTWMGKMPLAPWPVALYGTILLLDGFAFLVLTRTLISIHSKKSLLATSVGRDSKGWLSLMVYLISIVAAFWRPTVSCVGYVLVALIWLAPDRRIERGLERITANSSPVE